MELQSGEWHAVRDQRMTCRSPWYSLTITGRWAPAKHRAMPRGHMMGRGGKRCHSAAALLSTPSSASCRVSWMGGSQHMLYI